MRFKFLTEVSVTFFLGWLVLASVNSVTHNEVAAELAAATTVITYMVTRDY